MQLNLFLSNPKPTLPSTLGVGIAERPSELYTAMHSYLASCGVDGVKVDCQAGVGLVGSVLGGGPAASRDFQAALEQSVAKHFPENHCINCMCHSTENMYRFADTAVARVSDDFYPRDAASSTPHIAACAFNSVYMGAIVQPDWDMFQSAHPAAVLHGMARAVSGGAVYVSDKPGQHDFELLRRLVLPDGTVLRASLPGRPTRDTLFSDVLRDNSSLLKVWNTNPVVGVVGVFNLQGASWDRIRRKFIVHLRNPPTLSTTVAPGDVEVLRQQAEEASNGDGAAPLKFACYQYNSKDLRLMDLDESSPVTLQPSGSDMFWYSPVIARDGVQLAPLGLVDMYNGGGAITSVTLSSQRRTGSAAESSGLKLVASVGVRGCGKLLLYSSERPSHVWVNMAPRDFSYEPFSGRLEVEVPRASEGMDAELEVMY